MSRLAGTVGEFTSLKQNRQTISRRILAAIILMVLLSSGIRLFRLGDHSFWYDEAATAENVKSIVDYPQGDPWGIFSFSKEERVAPLYFFLVLPFYLLSNNELILRLPSVFSGVCSIPLIFLLGKQLANQRVGIIAALLLTLSPFHLYYSQELRPYSLFMFLALLALVMFNKFLEGHKTIYLWLTVVSITLGIYTHTYMIFVLLTLDLYIILNWRTNRPLLLKWFLCHLVIGVLCLPELSRLLYHIRRGNTSLADYSPGMKSIASTFYTFTFGRVFFPTWKNLLFILAQGIFWGIGLLFGVWSLWSKRANKQGRQAFTLVISAGIIYIFIILFSIFLIPLYDEARVNYLIFLFPLYLFIVALGWSMISKQKYRIALVSAALLISVVSSIPFFFQWEVVGKGNFRAAAEYIQNNLAENDVIYHTNNISTLPVGYYLDWKVQQILIGRGKASINISGDRFWLVVIKPHGAVEYTQMSFNQQDSQLVVQES
jgi:mannosyltransferase